MTGSIFYADLRVRHGLMIISGRDSKTIVESHAACFPEEAGSVSRLSRNRDDECLDWIMVELPTRLVHMGPVNAVLVH